MSWSWTDLFGRKLNWASVKVGRMCSYRVKNMHRSKIVDIMLSRETGR